MGISALLVAVAGCKDEARQAAGDAAPPVVASAASANVDIAAPQPSVPALMDIPGRFQYESGHRPTNTVTAEQVFDAIAAQGEVLTDRKQHLANPFGAQYCQGAKADQEKHHYSLCEYSKEADAEAGIVAAETFGTTHRKVLRNGNSVLIARYEGATDTSKAEQIFRSLKVVPAKP